MTRVAVIGCGAWGSLIVRDLVSLGCQVSVADPSPESAIAARTMGAHEVVGSIDELGELDGYVIASPSRMHVAHLEQLLPRDRPIFCEKPLATSMADIERLRARASGLVFSMEKWRYHPGITWLAQCARERRLGELVGLSLIRVSGPSPGNVLSVIWHLMPHDLSIALEIMGELPLVMAAGASRVGEWTYGCKAALGTQPWVSVETNERRGRTFREVRMVCTEGEATLAGGYAESITIRRHSEYELGEAEVVPIANEMPLLTELRVFSDFLAGRGPAPKTTFADAALVVQRLEEIHRAAGVPLGIAKRPR